jgi:hypothetical protein
LRAGGRAHQLGVFLHDRVRSIVAVSESGELGVALRDCVEPWRALIRDVRSDEFDAAVAACAPWPWMVVGSGSTAPNSLRTLLMARPSIVAWYGATPLDMGGRIHTSERFTDIAGFVHDCLQREVGGMRLAAGTGIELPLGRFVRSASLEALIGAHPAGFELPLRLFRSGARVLRMLDVPWRPQRAPASGNVVLAPCVSPARVVSV